jgi:hypothetical protein
MGLVSGYRYSIWLFYSVITITKKFFRHIVAVVHFNANLHRDVKEREKDRAERIKVVYPKFKNGEATVRQNKAGFWYV